MPRPRNKKDFLSSDSKKCQIVDFVTNNLFEASGSETDATSYIEEIDSARCIASGLNNEPDSSLYVTHDIPYSLEEDLGARPACECKTMVVARYILISGNAVYKEHVGYSQAGGNSDKWR